METLKVQKREETGKELDVLREQGFLPGVLYGSGVKNANLKISQKDFAKALKEYGESSLLTLELDGKKHSVLIHQLSKDALGHFTHVDFYHPSATKEVEVEIPLVFIGESEAVDNLNGVLIKEIHELKVKGLALNLPKEIKVDISVLKSFEDRILVKDLKLGEGIEAQKEPDEIVALVEEAGKSQEEEPVKEPAVEGVAEAKEEEKE
ncbi:MAG: 50S ribosomal protein L25 [Candidatus Gribaldobacteria bacterium]|nr:50S ribosomal protein L25 [Candidatus Gribaldobacteria bacterium]